MSRTYITLVVPGINSRQIADLHVPILEALRQRDPELAVQAYHRHFLAAGAMFSTVWVDAPIGELETPPSGGVPAGEPALPRAG